MFQIRVAGELGPDYRLRVLVDTRGTPDAEVVMVTTVRNLDLVACNVHLLEGPRIEANCDATRSARGGAWRGTTSIEPR
jgi:hypothetical protein